MTSGIIDIEHQLKLRLGAIGLVLCQIALTLAIAYFLLIFLAYLLDVNASVVLSSTLRFFCIIPLIAGVMIWTATFKVRRPGDMMISTYVTMTRLTKSHRSRGIAQRSEPFIPVGPYRYVRNPLYLGIILFASGIGIGLSSLLLLFWVPVLICWFWFLLIPYEEKELVELFGEHYLRYKSQVPKLFPDGRKYVENPETNQSETHQN